MTAWTSPMAGLARRLSGDKCSLFEKSALGDRGYIFLASGVARELSRIAGSGVSMSLLRKSLLSLLLRVHQFLSAGSWHATCEVPPSCLRELSFLLYLTPLMVHSLKADESDRAYFTDACMSGASVTNTVFNCPEENALVLDIVMRKE